MLSGQPLNVISMVQLFHGTAVTVNDSPLRLALQTYLHATLRVEEGATEAHLHIAPNARLLQANDAHVLAVTAIAAAPSSVSTLAKVRFVSPAIDVVLFTARMLSFLRMALSTPWC